MIKLFLDDIRMPRDVYSYYAHSIYKEFGWDIVRNYNDFIKFITENGMPDLISFDHDLADEHYVPIELHIDYAKSKAFQDAQKYTEKTGYECAKWLIEYCMDNNVMLPKYLCHSLNPVGRDNILNLLDSFNSTFRQYENLANNID